MCSVSAVKHGIVSRQCGPDGQWVLVNGTQPWRDYSQCEEGMESTTEVRLLHLMWGCPSSAAQSVTGGVDPTLFLTFPK